MEINGLKVIRKNDFKIILKKLEMLLILVLFLLLKIIVRKTGEFVTINGKNILCDGKICGKGRSTGGRYICPHNNLKVKFPELIEEWSHENEGKPEYYLPCSGKKVLWKCKNAPCDCHEWYATIANRTGESKSGCPFCANEKPCLHYNLKVIFPNIADEWSIKNDKKPEDYLPYSSKNVLWKCKNDPCGCHSWSTQINYRTSSKSGCPFCDGKPCPHNNFATLFPDLLLEWDPSNGIKPEECPPHSNLRILWICKKNSNHKWSTKICNRTKNNGTGCPHCVLINRGIGYSNMATD